MKKLTLETQSETKQRSENEPETWTRLILDEFTWSAGTLWMNASSEYINFMYFQRYDRSPGMWKSAKNAPATLKIVVFLIINFLSKLNEWMKFKLYNLTHI